MLKKIIWLIFILLLSVAFFLIYQKPASFSKSIFFIPAIIFFIGIILIYFFKYRDIVSPDATLIKSSLNIDFLGEIPYVKKESCQNIFELRKKETGLKTAFTKIKSATPFLNNNNNPVVLGVTSAFPKEGKSFCAANLAIAFAEEKEDTLLINANLRKQFLSVFGTKSNKGLSDFCSKESSFDEAISSTDLDHFFFMPQGPVFPNPQELLKTKNLDNLIEAAKKKFKKIVISLPPALTCADASLIGDKCDGIILVVSAQKNHLNSLVKVKNILNRNTKIIGALLNKTPF
ncbi:MAG: CpsD/CapB family tyrosine-protein kinase [Candidatus Omnitrophica bacterium]|nr:CpsD/CapB family tyrosine-protein kinase [Candidatus Omnitrophota bacterium]MCF7892158.1 CpsD/CapB family tyrosine-protein kinase [Candidatus Omnitrophota bacterium]MCF7895824.1 CpsD/CapB family tyrosine-protein kinase [Candidatus Omnitrophota bacterium]MCF7897415.1 CpsD/CapB family tyrosine-protein kinase [Candidatus Omnitrophota bacterium]MCF7909406.1 CpsD/CapB family tyrosine-protein kinase [Candidatus Omnitrophota bacterium]